MVIIQSIELSTSFGRGVAIHNTICSFLLACNTIHLISETLNVVEGVSNHDGIVDEVLLYLKLNLAPAHFLLLAGYISAQVHANATPFCTPNISSLIKQIFFLCFSDKYSAICLARVVLPLPGVPHISINGIV